MKLNLSVSQPTTSQSVQFFESDQGARIFQIPVEGFPGFWVYVYLVLVGDYQVMIDTGSGFGVSNEHLARGMEAIVSHYDSAVGLDRLTHILITHGHIDHFGGLPFMRSHSSAQVGVHELDLRNLTNTEERLTIVSLRLHRFLEEAGILPQHRKELIQIYKLTKLDYVPVPVDFTYGRIGMKLGPFEMLHVPGHCAGQVVIRLHDVLFSGDHVLADISPHQAPERLVLHTGLGHYLDSLSSLERWTGDIHLTLGGHNSPIRDLKTRLDEIRGVHCDRLAKVAAILQEPHTVSEVSSHLFPKVHGYNVLLALEESGAHVEYLYQRGILGIANLAELEASENHIPIYYQALGTDF
jgi:glyoxylase-like metal-dependent hydrolase (beta-lactamase superfamily II)